MIPVVLALLLTTVGVGLSDGAITRVVVGPRTYDIPTGLIDRGELYNGRLEGGVDLLLMWPGLDTPPPPGVTSYKDDAVSVYIQVIPPAFGPFAAGFLRLWRLSTSDTFIIAADALIDLEPGPPVEGLGLLRLRPDGRTALTSGRMQASLDGIIFYADAMLPDATSVMTCDAETSCALWWRQDGAAAEAIFDVRHRDQWATVKAKATALFNQFRVR